jgi:dTDP-4-amino-4,6-dideoxygalactose transaminase
VVQVGARDQVAAQLAAQGIHTAVHYPVPLPLMEAYRYLGGQAAQFPRAAANAARILSLPMYPELTRAQVERVAENLKKAVAQHH